VVSCAILTPTCAFAASLNGPEGAVVPGEPRNAPAEQRLAVPPRHLFGRAQRDMGQERGPGDIARHLALDHIQVCDGDLRVLLLRDNDRVFQRQPHGGALSFCRYAPNKDGYGQRNGGQTLPQLANQIADNQAGVGEGSAVAVHGAKQSSPGLVGSRQSMHIHFPRPTGRRQRPSGVHFSDPGFREPAFELHHPFAVFFPYRDS